MSFQKKNDNYCNDSCIHKVSCRYILRGLLDDLKLPRVSSVTLPNLNFDLEDYIIRKKSSCDLYFCEINKSVYKKQFKKITDEVIPVIKEGDFWKSRKIYHFSGDAFDLKAKHKLNFIWFDLCGYLRSYTIEGLHKFLRNNTLDDKGIFSITLMSSRQSNSAQRLYRDLQRNFLGSNFTTVKNFTSVKLPKILEIMLTSETNINFQLVTNYSYKPSSGGGIMTMYAFRWKRE